MNKKIHIAVLFHNTFFLHGDRGNIMALQKLANEASIETSVEYFDDFSSEFNPDDYDIIFCGPGEISGFEKVKEFLLPKKDQLNTFIESGKILLVTGTSMCLFGNETIRTDGSIFHGLGIIDCSFKEREYPYGNDLHYMVNYNNSELEIFGSQIQMMDIISNEPPFGSLKYGLGNGIATHEEGVLKKNSIFTNTLGPILVLNPWLTEEILKLALSNNGIDHEFPPMNMELELKSLEAKKRFTIKKGH